MPLEVMLLIVVAGVAAAFIAQGVVVVGRRRKGPASAGSVAAESPASAASLGMSCCASPTWVAERDVGSARGFDLMLGKCGACGTAWINAWCVASSMGGYEPVKPADAEAMRAIEDPTELEQFMRRWTEHLA
jgi:hypothetical protein